MPGQEALYSVRCALSTSEPLSSDGGNKVYESGGSAAYSD